MPDAGHMDMLSQEAGACGREFMDSPPWRHCHSPGDQLTIHAKEQNRAPFKFGLTAKDLSPTLPNLKSVQRLTSRPPNHSPRNGATSRDVAFSDLVIAAAEMIRGSLTQTSSEESDSAACGLKPIKRIVTEPLLPLLALPIAPSHQLSPRLQYDARRALSTAPTPTTNRPALALLSDHFGRQFSVPLSIPTQHAFGRKLLARRGPYALVSTAA
ncbi:hypothetical protein BGW80DRAFT_1457447 [Lactifluus volemus]|nr:hypothetical protein BGW80DRAFT_1457447 [Lactifluus volemus]